MMYKSKVRWLILFVFISLISVSHAQQVRSEVWSANVYPNPSEGIIHLELSGKFDELTHINIVDANGKTVFVENVANDQIIRIDLRSVAKGTYTMQMMSTNVYKKQTLVLL